MPTATSFVRGPWLLLLLYLLVGTTAGQQDGLVTIYENPNFSSLRQCAQNCFVITQVSTRDLLGPKMRCSISTVKSSKLAMNNCYCRPDLRTDAHDFISSCVSTKCPFNENDIVTAQFVYDDYCSSNGYYGAGAPEPTAAAGDDGDGGGSGPAPGAGAGTQSVPTGRARSAANNALTVPGQLVLGLTAIVRQNNQLLSFVNP
jgi:hypothetical protein